MALLIARCLLHEKELPKKFLTEEVNSVVFLLNGPSAKALQKKTPSEACDAGNSKFLNLKIFECKSVCAFLTFHMLRGIIWTRKHNL